MRYPLAVLFVMISLLVAVQAGAGVTGEFWIELGLNSATDNGISNDTLGGASTSSIAVDPVNGHVYIAWESGNSEIYVKKWNGSVWSEVGAGSASAAGISNNTGLSRFPSIAIGTDQQPVVTWIDKSSGNWEIYVRKFQGVTWDPTGSPASATGGGISNALGTITVPEGNQPKVAVYSSTAPAAVTTYVAWSTGSIAAWKNHVIVSTPSGSGTWKQLGDYITSQGDHTVDRCGGPGDPPCEECTLGAGPLWGYGGAGNPSLALGSDGKPVVVYTNGCSGINTDVHARRWTGVTWQALGTGAATDFGISSIDPHHSSGYAIASPQIAVGPDGSVFAAWGYHDNVGTKLLHVRKFAGSAWTTLGTNAASNTFSNTVGLPNFSITAGTDNLPLVAWTEVQPFVSEIYLRKWSNTSGWQEFGVGSASGGGISSNGGISGYPALAVDRHNSLNNPYITWSDLNDISPPMVSQIYARGMRATGPEADLAITKTDTPDPVLQGQSLTYTIQATNNGPYSATGVSVVDALPTGLTFNSAASTQGSCSELTGTVTCTIGPIGIGASATITLVVTPTVNGLISNTVTVNGNEADPVSTNNTATQDTTVLADTDGDGIDDAWEMTWFGNLTTANATSDFDHDGITDLQEYLNGTNPTAPNVCIKSGYVPRVTVKPGASNSTIYLRTSSLASSYKTFTTTDTKLIKAAVKSLPGRTYVKIKGNADCTTATSGGAAQYVIVAP